jgi:cytochrome P450
VARRKTHDDQHLLAFHRFTGHPPHPHVAFGYGAHRCLAASLARIELTEAFRALVIRCPTLHLTIPAEEVAWTDGLTYRPQSLPVTTAPDPSARLPHC